MPCAVSFKFVDVRTILRVLPRHHDGGVRKWNGREHTLVTPRESPISGWSASAGGPGGTQAGRVVSGFHAGAQHHASDRSDNAARHKPPGALRVPAWARGDSDSAASPEELCLQGTQLGPANSGH